MSNVRAVRPDRVRAVRAVRVAAVGLALSVAPVAIGPGLAVGDPHVYPAGYGQAIDYVVQRALSQRGVPYVYGGGNAFGPTNGVRPGADSAPGNTPATTGPAGAAWPTGPGVAAPRIPGRGVVPNPPATPATPITVPIAPATPTAGTVGFDSSGLIQYAFAGAGIKLPRTSGQQCSVGRKVPPSQARRGDLICYGPGGSQSVALYLGNGQMIEGTDPAVTVSAARTSNMDPYLTRILES